MRTHHMPRYPVYIPSHSRYQPTLCKTARFLKRDGVPFRLVVEESQADHYRAVWGEASVLVLPQSSGGSVMPSRNWIKEHSVAAGDAWHWQLDDNINSVRRMYKGNRVPCRAGVAMRCIEDFCDRYENIGLAGMNYMSFLPRTAAPRLPPFQTNVHVYSCVLVNNATPFRWRTFFNDDTDMCLQVLSAKLCIVAFNAFMAHKTATMTMKGGYAPVYKGNGRLTASRSLEHDWPHVVTVGRRFGRAHHYIKDNWTKFDTPLIRKPEFANIPNEPNEYGMTLVEEPT
jgi:hypothetical protein